MNEINCMVGEGDSSDLPILLAFSHTLSYAPLNKGGLVALEQLEPLGTKNVDKRQKTYKINKTLGFAGGLRIALPFGTEHTLESRYHADCNMNTPRLQKLKAGLRIRYQKGYTPENSGITCSPEQ